MIVGISGHQDLGSAETIAWIRSAVGAVLAKSPPDLGLTSLAVGADQLFAELLVSQDIPFDFIVPCANYERTFEADTIAAYRALEARARSHIILPFPDPSEAAFMAAGQRIVDDCDLLISIWDGEPSKGLGGTADIVAYALHSGRDLIHIDPVRRLTT